MLYLNRKKCPYTELENKIGLAAVGYTAEEEYKIQDCRSETSSDINRNLAFTVAHMDKK